MKKAIIVASFGTTHIDAWKSCILPIEDMARKAFPEYEVIPAFTSSMIRSRLDKLGFYTLSPEEALNALEKEGVQEVFILPTHLLPGYEYEKIQVAAEPFPGMRIRLAQPLLGIKNDFDAVLGALLPAFPHTDGAGLVLMGHGSEHQCNALYAEMNGLILEKSLGNIFVATLEAGPCLEEAIEHMRRKGVTRVTLTPLMLVAGDHAKNDMAGDDDSWLRAFQDAGFEASAVVKGLGEYPGIRALYERRLRELFKL